MYKAQYKCRLCGERVYPGLEVENEQSVKANIESALKYDQFKGDPFLSGMAINLVVVHNCTDGSTGIADLAGFRKEQR